MLSKDVLPNGGDTSEKSTKKPSKPRRKLPSKAKAINQHCKDCIYDSSNGGGTWRQRVEACTVTRCSLYPVRPLSRPHTEAEEE